MAKDGRPRTLPSRNGTEIEMDLPDYGYPKVVIAHLDDAQLMVAILRRNGVRTNLRGVSLEDPGADGVQKA